MKLLLSLLLLAAEIFAIDALLSFFEAYRTARYRMLSQLRAKTYRDFNRSN